MKLTAWVVAAVLSTGAALAQMQGDSIPTSEKHPVASVQDTETAAQRDMLAAMGCRELQGFFLARPLAGDALEVLCEQQPG